MKIETTKVTKLTISGIDRLDPVSVILEDIGPHQGEITIKCYGQAWSAYWGSMGDRPIAEFFASCDVHYLAGKLSNIRSSVVDIDGITEHAKRHILRMRREKEIGMFEARDLFNQAGHINDPFEESKLMIMIYGDDWWHALPEKTNIDYEYLCRIINAVKDALKIGGGIAEIVPA